MQSLPFLHNQLSIGTERDRIPVPERFAVAPSPSLFSALLRTYCTYLGSFTGSTTSKYLITPLLNSDNRSLIVFYTILHGGQDWAAFHSLDSISVTCDCSWSNYRFTARYPYPLPCLEAVQ